MRNKTRLDVLNLLLTIFQRASVLLEMFWNMERFIRRNALSTAQFHNSVIFGAKTNGFRIVKRVKAKHSNIFIAPRVMGQLRYNKA